MSKKQKLNLGKLPVSYIYSGILVVLIAILVVLGLNLDLAAIDKELYELQNSIQVPSAPSIPTTGEAKTAKVQRVIDGDTLELEDGRRVRYLMIDTPETKKPGTPVMCYGPEASAFNKLMAENKIVNLVPDKRPTDRYGRELYFIFLSGANTKDISQSLNAELVKKGYARSSAYAPNTTYKAEFQKFQNEAQSNKLGAWANCPKPFEE